MPTNQILQFAGGGGANVLSPAAYAALASIVANGFQSGVLPSNQLNVVLRQSAFVSAMIAQFIADKSGQNVNDDGNLATLEANFIAAFSAAGVFQTPSPGDNTTKAATTAFLAAALTAKFKGTLGANGYASFEVDDAGTKKTFIVQRGRVAVTDNTIATVTLPFTFPTACRFVGATPDCAAAVGGTDIIAAHASIVSPSQITVGVSTNNSAIVSNGAYWLAIGE